MSVRSKTTILTILLDANALIALLVVRHVHHGAAEAWLADSTDSFATCPITEGALVRQLVRDRQSPLEVRSVLGDLANQSRHEFWADSLPYAAVSLDRIIGHRQVTDAYLVHLAREHRSRLITFDRGLALAYPDVADLLPLTPDGIP